MSGDAIKTVRELPLGAWLLIAASAAILGGLAVYMPDLIPEPYPNTRQWIILVAFITSPIGFLWGAWKAIAALYLALSNSHFFKVRRVSKQYKSLPQESKDFLNNIFSSGSDDFEVTPDFSQKRWFKKLESGGFIKSEYLLIYYAGINFPYKLSRECSEALESIRKLS